MRGVFLSFPSAHPRAWQDGMVSFPCKVCTRPSCFLIRLHMLPFATRQTTSACGGDRDTRQSATPPSITTSAHAPSIISHNSFLTSRTMKLKLHNQEKPWAWRLLDERFDLLELQEYGTDGDQCEGYIAEKEEEFLAQKLRMYLTKMIWKTRSLMTSIKLLLLLHGSESPKSEELLDSAADIMRRCKRKWRWKSAGSLNSDLLKRKQHG